MELRQRDRIVQIKIVYYGPPVGGKTTNLQRLHAAAQGRHRGEFISVNSAQDRTILCDLLPLKGVGLHAFEIRFQLVAVPGQAKFVQTRRLVVRGADAVVFVADSATGRLRENVESLWEMTEHLVMNRLDPATIPLVFQHNKRDLPDVRSSQELAKALGYRDAPHHPAVAIRGEGVLETLGAVVEQAMARLMTRYPALALARGDTVHAWTSEVLHRVFGASSIARDGPLEGPPAREDRRVVRVSVPRSRSRPLPRPDETLDLGTRFPISPDRAGAAPPPVSSRPALAETYAQASMDLGLALQRMRDERDEARRRLDELEHTLRAIEAVGQGRPPEDALQEVLQRIVVGGGGRGATLLAAVPNRTFRLVAGAGLKQDPFLRLADGVEVVRQTFVPLRKPTLVTPENEPAVARAVAPLKPPVKAVAGVPVRSALGLHGLVLLYYGRTDPLPSPATLTHLGNLARALAAWFSVQRAASVSATADALRQTLPQLESAARQAWGLVRAARNPGVTAPPLEQVERALHTVMHELSRINAPTRTASSPSRTPSSKPSR